MSSLRTFPFHFGRSVGVVVVWNLLFGVDRLILGSLRCGYLSLLACAGFAVLFLTAPMAKQPGRWLVKDQQVVDRFRWVSWYIALLAGGSGIVIGHQLVRDGFVW